MHPSGTQRLACCFPNTHFDIIVAEEDDMLKRALPSALAAAALGVAASGYSVPDFAQNLPARCLPQEAAVGSLHDGCNGLVRFGMTGAMVMPGQALDVEATGSITRGMTNDAAETGRNSPQ
jgi:hypothetical protein